MDGRDIGTVVLKRCGSKNLYDSYSDGPRKARYDQ